MLQKRISNPQGKEDKKKASLKAKFETEKQNKVEKALSRTVSIKVAVGCGCGGDYKWYNGKVPADSSIHDGDYFDEIPSVMVDVHRGRIQS